IKEEVQNAVTVDPNLVAPDFSAQGEEAQAPATNE
ncbi:MAG: preprotein translocase subunit SecG, partial [Bacteroidales bacterium]|nr:preprotein translocase subunit SecG [Bacteroidales bacterium]